MHVTLLAVQSLDGFITRHDKPGTAFASGADQTHLRTALKSFDCSIMGAESYRTSRDDMRPKLHGSRLRMILTHHPQKYNEDVMPGILEFTDLQPAELLASLTHRGCRRCALLGGSQVYSLFLERGLVDEIWLTLEPRLFGHGTKLLASAGDVPLKFLASENLSADTLLLKYKVQK